MAQRISAYSSLNNSAPLPLIMRLQLFFLGLALCLTSVLAAQPVLVNGDVCLDVEVVAIHTEGDLEGMTTYRLYATLPGPADVVTTVFGDVEHPTSLQTTTSFYQSPLGGQFPCANNPILFDAFPDLAWDSWLTIGVDGPPQPELGEDCPQVVMSTQSPFMTEFENGSGFTIDDMIGSAWFVVPSNTNGIPDADGRVLLAQLTTDGALSGVLYMQVLPGGIGTLAEIVELPLYGPCDPLTPEQCPEEIFAVEGACEWGFEVSNFQPGEAATWTFGDDVQEGGHYATYTFAGDGSYPVAVTFTSDYCPEGVTLATTVEVDACSAPDCGLELNVETAQEGEVIMVIPVGYPEGVELVYSLNGEVFQEGGLAITLPIGTADAPWQVCVQYISEDCPEGVVACTESEGYESGCPSEIWVGGADCEYIFSICDYTEGESVAWSFSDSTEATGHFTWHTFPEDGVYEACATYVSPSCPDSTVLCTTVEVEGCGPCVLDVFIAEEDPENGTWTLATEGAPEGAVVEWFDGEGNFIAQGEGLDVTGGGVFCAMYETPECPNGVQACIILEEAVSDCNVGLALTALEICGEYLAQYEGEPGAGDVLWYLDEVLMQTGGSAFDFSVDSAQMVALCVVATGADCPEGEEVCIEVENEGCEPCLSEDDAEMMVQVVDDGSPCQVFLMLEMMQPDDAYIEWEFGDGMSTTSVLLWTEHQYAESGVYEACATVYSPGCPEGSTWCIEVVVEGCDSACEPVVIAVEPNGVSGYYSWSGYGDYWSGENVFFIPSGSAEPVELGLCLSEDCYVFDFSAFNTNDPAADLTISVSDAEGPLEWEEEPYTDEAGWQVITFGIGGVGCGPDPALCTLEIEALQEADGSWTLTAVTESVEDVDFLWTLSDGSVLNGVTVNHAFVEGVEVVTACVAAAFPECEEVLSACIDLENGANEGCEAVEVVIEGETFDELLEDLVWAWTLLGEGFDWSGTTSLDPEDLGVDGLVLCLPPGCYAMSMEMSGLPGFQGLPGMTMSLTVGGEDELEVDLMLLDGVFDLEFGVLTDCSNAVNPLGSSRLSGLSIFPNPAQERVTVSMDEGAFSGDAHWILVDGLGRVVLEGTSHVRLWNVPLKGLSPGGYVLHVESGTQGLHQRVMVAR